MSEKKYATTITDMPSPPLTQPISARASSTSAWLMPQRSIRLPANTKAGIASSTQLCEPDTSAEDKLLHRIAADPQAGDAGDAEREHDRHREQDQHDEDDGDDRKQHERSASVPRLAAGGGGAIITAKP